MKALISVILLLAYATAFAAPPADSVQYCNAPAANSTVTGNLVGCPPGQSAWGPLYTNSLVRTIVNGSQTWVPYSALGPSSQVVVKSTGKWTAFSLITEAPKPVAPPPPPVVVSTTATILVTWSAPTTNVDGSSLTDLTSYNIYMGASASNMSAIGHTKAGTTSFTTQPLGVGTYYFTVSAVNSSGVESDKTGPVSTVISAPAKTPNAPTNLKVIVNSAGSST